MSSIIQPLGKKQLTPAEQRLADEATVFKLAAYMLDCYTAILTKNSKNVMAVVMQINALLKTDPSFMMRFKAAQMAIAEAQQKARAKVEPPQDSA